MRLSTKHAVLMLAVGLAMSGCASDRAQRAQAGPAVVPGTALEGREDFYRAGDLVFGPQPDAAGFEAFRADGVATVINLRSHEEMTTLLAEEGLDETSTLSAQGVRYIHIPLGGDDGYEPADVEAFAAAIEGAQGPVLIHCASGGRARTMWQAYLVKHRGYTLREAEEVASTIGGTPTALEQLLGRDVRTSLGGTLPTAPKP